MTTVLNQTVSACWIIFILYWAVSARGTKPALERQSWLSSLAHRGPLTLGGILLWSPALPHPMSLALTPHTGPARGLAAIFCVLGLFVAIWSRRLLAGNWSSTVTFKRGHELIQSGPYRFARHPIYTGILLMCLGTAIAGGRLHCWLGFLVICAGFWIKLAQEESLLLRHFPDDYPSYRNRVKALVPFVI
jgi:protein-S-isoprenylcysteine O-methyltransferase Ste14